MVRRRVAKITIKRTVRVRREVQLQRRVVTRQELTSPTRPVHRTISTTRAALPPGGYASALRDDGFAPIEDPDREFDLFLSHAAEDKDIATELYELLTARSLSVWFDDAVLKVGDSLRESIDNGLRRCRFGTVLFSQSFFSKRWTNYELNGLVAREMQGRKVVLPVWHPDLDAEAVVEYSPSLADKKALRGSALSLPEIADELVSLVLGD